MTRRHACIAVSWLVAVCLVTSCRGEEPPAIEVREVDVIVQNQTATAWTNLEIWVNDFYRGLHPSLGAGQRLVVPLGSLVEGYGRRFDVHRTPVASVLVTARSVDGRPIRLTWGKVRRQ
jgi:hypothetical protein